MTTKIQKGQLSYREVVKLNKTEWLAHKLFNLNSSSKAGQKKFYLTKYSTIKGSSFGDDS